MPFDLTIDGTPTKLQREVAPMSARSAYEYECTINKMLELFGENGEHWTQFHFARDERGAECSEHSDGAYSFCFFGGLRKVGGDDYVGRLVECVIDGDIVAFNDGHHRTYKEVQDVLMSVRNELQLHRERLTTCQTQSSRRSYVRTCSKSSTTS